MTVEPLPSSQFSDPSAETSASSSRTGGGAVADGAEAARGVATEVTEQAKAVAGHAKGQVEELVSQARSELQRQASDRSAQAASGVRSLADQVTVLREGRTEDAGSLVGYLDEANSKLGEIANRIEQGGPQGVLDDVTSFARRRPGLFLAGAVAAGFLAGRLVRATTASDDTDQQSRASGLSSGVTSPTPYGAPVVEPADSFAPAPMQPAAPFAESGISS